MKCLSQYIRIMSLKNEVSSDMSYIWYSDNVFTYITEVLRVAIG